MERLVVGVDGSKYSKPALEWAAQQARARNARLVVLYAWTVPVMTSGTFVTPYRPALDAKRHFEAAAQATVDQALAEVDLEGVDVEVRLVQGHPGMALVEQSADAAMVVVGNGGRSSLSELLLGSTARYVTRHAKVPAVVVPEEAVVAAAA